MEVIETPLRERDAEVEEITEQLHHHNKKARTEYGIQAAINIPAPTSLPCPPACDGDLRTLEATSRVAAPVTPKKRKRSESGAEPGDQGDQALTPTRKRLTPEEREALRVQKEEEKLKKAEEKKKKEEERERKKKELEEKKAQKELEKAKRDAEREEKKKLKEDEKARKDEERKKKEEDKKKKDEEDKRKKEEDKLKKEEGRKKREEEKKKKEDERTKELEAKLKLAEKQKSILTSFLKKAAPPAAEVKPVAVKNKEEEGDNLFHFHLLFKGVDVPPHTVRSSYLPTPVPGIGRLASHEIEAALVNNTDRLPSLADWQAEVRSRKLARRAYEKLQREEARQRRETAGDDEDSDVMLIEQSVAMNASSQRSLRRRMKFFKFHENNRPAYFGTCSKKSHCISPRNPFKQDTLLLDYECDSDDEWEEEGEGESLEDSEGEEEEEEAAGEGDDDDEEEDDGFMVPDGYLSEDEGVEDSDAEDDALGGKGKEKVKVKVSDGMDLEGAELAKEKERRRRWKEKQNEEGGKGGKVAKLRTVAVGPVFCMRSADVPLQYSGLFADFAVRVLADLTNGPIDPETTPAKEKAEPRDNSLPDAVLRDLIRNVHGDTMGMKNVVGRFYDKYVTEPSLQRYTLTKNGLIKKVREIAVREKRADDTKPRWHVAESLLQSLGMDEECAQILATRRQADSVTPRKKRTRPSLTGATTTVAPTIAAGGAATAQPVTPSAAPVVATTIHHHRTPELPSTPSSAPASVVSTPERKRGGAATKPKTTKDILNFFNAAAASPSKSATTTSSTSTTTSASLAPPASPSSASQSEEASGAAITRNSPTVIAAGTAMDVDPLMPDIL